ncbi:pyridoxal-phosphate dependent enzyme [Shewanella fidelis]|uniref:Pyridoxal-phosphate dependent enzyme n=1 Tax=Shewanella fidelis TaxID=173509 RepID=A0AAW8NN76_9GAMM|nr:pyridoxal-phosphate dependent enzyme [Shewanella fidelis]MDR8523631.1 pyridoxal-phosphate dependent enzyme [Shewanella fidelis]MDW4810178.1 pyridoxal-phosphate dependent enzyme [Shewanella fidelis]MDW4814323.1 pyridoxal-phosphate dependent enzyme [Shewanella fidelis]MDW4818414.1 pyridoxal-phosphate dependent enzyme [Shewanella fidelis]MDW4823934.1 pyridoxal-phosphate dependent enzyme [Shewanella fidelis]
MFADTPIDSIVFNDQQVFVKRDDLLSKEFSGNKARKFAYFLENDFPGKTGLVGHGSPVANSLYSMSALAKLKGVSLDFYVDHIAEQVLQSTTGNYAESIANGANVIDVSKCEDRDDLSVIEYIQQKVLPDNEHLLFVPEGGRCEYARFGVHKLAQEIIDWSQQQSLPMVHVFLPSGTGTTAVFLSEYLTLHSDNIKVFTCACVGGDDYLQLQFDELLADRSLHPTIVDLGKKYHFGKLYKPFYDMYNQLLASGIEFELLYDPLGWMCVEKLIQQNTMMPNNSSSSAATILYIHQGGLLGNETMLPRYQRKYG